MRGKSFVIIRKRAKCETLGLRAYLVLVLSSIYERDVSYRERGCILLRCVAASFADPVCFCSDGDRQYQDNQKLISCSTQCQGGSVCYWCLFFLPLLCSMEDYLFHVLCLCKKSFVQRFF